MSEEQEEYSIQPAAIIDPPRTVKSISENGVSDYKVWGWVKLSAKFIYHIRMLKGAKLAIMMTLALSVDETGKCKRTIKQLCELTDYSHTEVIDSLKELDEMGYLTIKRDSKGNIYDPEFVARGENLPSENVVKKLESTPVESTPVESTPVYQVESSPSEGKSDSSFNRVKRVNTAYNRGEQELPDKVSIMLDMEKSIGAQKLYKTDALLSRWSVAFLVKTTSKDWRKFAEYAVEMQTTKGWNPDRFIEWVKKQEGYPTYWSQKRMEENYMKAFMQDDEPEDWRDRSHAL